MKNKFLTLVPTAEDLRKAAKYASLSLPWTFNRMMKNTSSRSQQNRAFNIAKGIASQEVLKRHFIASGLSPEIHEKSYREEDCFDFRILIDGSYARLDLKTLNIYTDYFGTGRDPFSLDLVSSLASYCGNDWRGFFPMLVPHTQIRQEKHGYCFAIGESVDFRRDVLTNRSEYLICAFPFGKWLPFFCSRRLCESREDGGGGFFIRLRLIASEDNSKTAINVQGEWNGKGETIRVTLNSDFGEPVGPLSMLSSVTISKEDYEHFSGAIEIDVVENRFTDVLENSAGLNINEVPNEYLRFEKSDFCNLHLPRDYRIHVVGWTGKDEFFLKCSSRLGWIWPNDKVDKYKNQDWCQFTDRDIRMITGAGFSKSIQEGYKQLQAGFLKTHGHGGGACCYFYPNLGRGGGVLESNLYILVSDLLDLDTIK